ncbi:MAG: ferritin family protein [Burkholderiales bacterium]|nr:ferritin family protein [Burkholderiales bacterium]
MTAWPVAALPPTLEHFMAEALVMESEAAQRYAQLADVMEACNNTEVAELFRKMAGYEREHANAIAERMGWHEHTMPDVVLAHEPPEAIAPEELHYLMQPWHALRLALAAEKNAELFFSTAVRIAECDEVRKAAAEMQAEEAEHVRLIEEWLARLSPPDANWSDDPDPPRYTD